MVPRGGWRRWGELLLVPGRAVGGGPADPDAGSGDVAVMGESAGPRGPVTAWGGGKQGCQYAKRDSGLFRLKN